MVKKLQRKFIAVTMMLLTLIFTGVFTINYIYDLAWYRETTLVIMEWIAESDSFTEGVRESDADGVGSNPVYAVTYSADNGITEIKSSVDSYDHNEISDISYEMIKQGADESRYGSYIYYMKEDEGALYLVFTDMKMNLYDIIMLLGRIGLFVVTLLISFAVSCFLSRFVTEPAERMLKREKQFISDASHELKTPVTAIKVNAQAMAAQGEGGRLLKNILTETGRMTSLIHELLDFSYIEERGSNVKMTSFSLSEGAEEIALSMECAAYEKNITFQYDIEKDIIYIGSSDDIKRVIAILLDNAIRHTPPQGKIELKLYTKRRHPVISVYNTGQGIPENELPHIFERFYRVEKERDRKSGSFGLGLSIARTIIDAHSGEIRVESIYGEYTEFEVLL